MPLRVTIELIPFGDEGKKRTIAIVDIVNNLKGTQEKGNYDVKAKTYKEIIYLAETPTGTMPTLGTQEVEIEKKNIKGIIRGNVLYTVAECLRKLLVDNVRPSKG